MTADILRRLYQAIIVMLAVSLIAFTLFRFVGDPVSNMMSEDFSPEERAQVATDLGLNDPLPVQFARFLGNVCRGEFGRSYQLRQPVTDLMVQRLPATLELAAAAALLSLAIGIPFGIYTALRPDGMAARLVLGSSLIGVSLPNFLLGILLVLVFTIELGWLPSSGRGEIVQIGWWSTGLLTLSGLKALILPAITLASFQATLLMRLVRSEMLEILRADFIRFARARGLGRRALYLRHALRNTAIPILTVSGLQLGHLIAFSIVTETVFQWPGLGLLFIQAIGFADVPVMGAYLLFVAAVFVSINLVIDLLYYTVDPRLRIDRTRAAQAPG